MKDENTEPEDARLRDLLRASRPAPPLPPSFEEAVWHRIERANAPSEGPTTAAWLDGLLDRLLRPRVALAGLTGLLLAGSVAGVLSGPGMARQTAQERYLAAVAPATVR